MFRVLHLTASIVLLRVEIWPINIQSDHLLHPEDHDYTRRARQDLPTDRRNPWSSNMNTIESEENTSKLVSIKCFTLQS